MKAYEEILKDSLKAIELMIEQNITEKEIAKKLGIPYSTFRRYKTKNAELKAAINNGKDTKNQEVEKALYKGCVGYHYYEEVATKVKEEVMADDDKTVLVKEDVVIKSVKKYRGPDLAAQKYYLNNRDKVHWKDDPNKTANDRKLARIKETEVENKVTTNNKLVELKEKEVNSKVIDV